MKPTLIEIDDNDPVVEIVADLGFEDVLRENFRLLVRRARAGIAVYAVLAAALGGAWFSGALPHAAAAGLLGLLAAAPVLALGGVYWNTRRTFQTSAESPGRRRMGFHFSSEGVGVRVGRTPGWVEWDDITEAVETRGGFLLFLAPGEYYFAPKKSFSGDAQLRTVRELLRRNLGERAKLQRIASDESDDSDAGDQRNQPSPPAS